MAYSMQQLQDIASDLGRVEAVLEQKDIFKKELEEQQKEIRKMKRYIEKLEQNIIYLRETAE